VGEPPEGFRRFEVRLPAARGTASAVVIDGLGALVRDEANPAGSCFYLDLLVGSTYQVRYLAQAEHRDRGVVAAFSLREAAPAGAGWYDVLHQSCGSRDEPCPYESPADWTAAIRGGHRFHDECGSTELENINIEGGLYDRRFIDVQFTFDLRVRSESPEGPPGSRCRRRLNLAPEGQPPQR